MKDDMGNIITEYHFVSKLEVVLYFIENDIPYKDIDFEMRELIYLMNKYCGIRTKFCCIGHQDNLSEVMIMLEDDVTDRDVRYFMLEYLELPSMRCQELKKWMRRCPIPNSLGKMVWENWIWSVNIYKAEYNTYEYRYSEMMKLKTSIAKRHNLNRRIEDEN